MKSIGSIFAVMMLLMVVFISMQQVGEEAATNSQIDSASVSLIANYSSNIDGNLNYETDFDESASTLTANATFDSEDVFAQEFLEGRADSQSKTGIIKNLVKIPDLVFLSLGLPEASLIWIKGLIALILSIIIALATYRAIFGGGKVTDN